MANKRIFQAQALVTNGVAVGGLATLAFDSSYQDIINSTPDGAFGVEDVDRAGLRITAAMACSDISLVNAILAAATSTTTFSGKESGASTYHDYTAIGIRYHGMNLSLPKNSDGTLNCNGTIQFVDGTKHLDETITLLAGQAAPAQTYPARLYRPSTAQFVAGVSILPLHVQSIQLGLSAVLLQDYGDTDIGETAVDIAGWNPLQVTLVHRDATSVAPGDVNAQLIKETLGVLTVNLAGRAGAAGRILTVNALKWTGISQSHGPGYTDYTMTGTAQWKNGATVYGLTGANTLFEIV